MFYWYSDNKSCLMTLDMLRLHTFIINLFILIKCNLFHFIKMCKKQMETKHIKWHHKTSLTWLENKLFTDGTWGFWCAAPEMFCGRRSFTRLPICTECEQITTEFPYLNALFLYSTNGRIYVNEKLLLCRAELHRIQRSRRTLETHWFQPVIRLHSYIRSSVLVSRGVLNFLSEHIDSFYCYCTAKKQSQVREKHNNGFVGVVVRCFLRAHPPNASVCQSISERRYLSSTLGHIAYTKLEV